MAASRPNNKDPGCIATLTIRATQLIPWIKLEGTLILIRWSGARWRGELLRREFKLFLRNGHGTLENTECPDTNYEFQCLSEDGLHIEKRERLLLSCTKEKGA